MKVPEILESAAARAGAVYVSPGLSGVCRDYVEEQIKHGRSDFPGIVAEVAVFLREQALDEGPKRGGPQVRLAEQEGETAKEL